MLRVRDIMTPGVVSLAADQSLREAVDVLTSCRIGGAPVVEGTKVVGVLSARDIVEFEATNPRAAVSGRGGGHDAEREDDDEIEEWTEGEPLASSYFTNWWPNDAPDVVEQFAAMGDQWDRLSDHVVAEAMTRTVCTLDATTEVSYAAQRMLAAGVQRALVFDDGELAGILTTTDILRAVAERRLTVRHFVFEK